MVFSGGRNPSASSRPVWALQADVEASSCGGSGPRGHACRGAVARVIGVTPSGAEASSGPPDICRSQGRGVEEASGTPPTGTPGNLGRPFSYSYDAPFALRSRIPGIEPSLSIAPRRGVLLWVLRRFVCMVLGDRRGRRADRNWSVRGVERPVGRRRPFGSSQLESDITVSRPSANQSSPGLYTPPRRSIV